MKISYNWLTEYFQDGLPEPQKLAERLTMQAYEVEEVYEEDGDTILDIDVLPNRAADSLSQIGVAREVSTLFDLSLDLPFADAEAGDTDSKEYIDLSIASDNVRRATKRIVLDVDVGETPAFIKERLSRMDQRSHNTIVDITNYVMFETGQPVHAFDYDKIAGDKPKKITVREAEEGETITTLDGEEYELEEGMLVIADEEKPLDIAGIKGGANSGIDEDTERIVLSVCSFNPAKIRTTSQKLNLRTDASKRFENDISPDMPEVAMERLTQLVAEHAGGSVSKDFLDEYPQDANKYMTGVSVEEINELLGTDITQDDVKEVLERLGFEYEKVNPLEKVASEAPKYEGVTYKRGASISYDAPEIFDCSSFTGFLFSRAGVSIPRISVDQFVYGTPIDEEEMQPGDVVFYNTGERIIHYETQEYMPGIPVEEGIDHPAIYLGDGKVISATSYTGEITITDIDNPDFGKKIGIRRMVKSTPRFAVTVPYWRRDIRREVDLVEEIGRVHGYENIEQTLPEGRKGNAPVHKTFYYTQKIRDALVDAGFSEVYTYAFQEDGNIKLENPISEERTYLRKNIKDGLTQALDKNEKHKALLEGDEIRMFEIGKVFEKDREKLVLGIASSKGRASLDNAMEILSKELRLGGSIAEKGEFEFDENILEIDLDHLLDLLGDPDSYDDLEEIYEPMTYQPFSRYPYVLRDVAVWTPDEVKGSEVEEVIRETAGELLRKLELFDEYDPEDEERTSRAYRLVFQSDERTLSDEEVGEIMDDVYDALDQRSGWETR